MTPFFFLLAMFCFAPQLARAVADHVLDNFDSLAAWQAQHTDDVAATLSSAPGKAGKALRMDYDFTDKSGNPINGYATARRALPLDFSGNYELSFWVRGESGVNTLQFKLVDASGENVWWVNRPDFTFSHDWQQIRVRKREIGFAWGPTADRALKHTASVEFVVSSGRDGGKGTVEFDELAMRALPPQDDSPLKPASVSASSSLPDSPANAAVDGDRQTAWRSDAQKAGEQRFDIDLGKPRELSGIVVHWHHGERATSWQIEQSLDGKAWHSCGGALARSGDTTFAEVCQAGGDARYLRMRLYKGESNTFGIDEIEIKDPAWAATRNAFFGNVAKAAPRGAYPRGFVEQPYWTIVGVDGGSAPALISEDGAIEPRKGGWSIEPFLIVDAARLTWADVTATQSLLDGYLPMPRVQWNTAKLALSIDAFAQGSRAAPQLVARYRVRNLTDAPVDATLQLAIRPFQVNPPAQFLNSPGGVAHVQSLRWNGDSLQVDDASLKLLSAPDDVVVLNSDGTASDERLLEQADGAKSLHDEMGGLSSALVYRLRLPARGEREIDIVAPISAPTATAASVGADAPAWAAREQAAVAATWRERLDRVTLKLPPQAQRIADALRTAHAHMLLSRDGASLRPGTRSYARSWIRDGAMIADALLRFGDTDAAREYAYWYAPHQFANGKVPCCVDHRGSDPVPENDSHGELIHAIAQVYRYGGDRAGLERNWPHVDAAIAYMDRLRASEPASSESGLANAYKGLLPASISHEGYSAKPMHSYWDDAWGLTGYNDAVELAQALGRQADVERIAAARDQFRADILASIQQTTKTHAIDFVPGCAELGDFDATSTTVMLSPAGLQSVLPPQLVRNTFERYWESIPERRDGIRLWKDYTPYEWRTVGTFVRLGQRERAQAAIDFFFSTGARPLAWNQWAEVVGRDPREIRFIGDMPHAWVASDFARSALDLFAYERESDRALVLAGGVAEDWLAGDGVAIEHLRTPYGELGYSLRRNGKRVTLQVEAGAKPPGGFVFAWPGRESPPAVRVNGKGAQWKSGELYFATVPATIVIE